MEFEKVLLSRKSCRSYKADKVEKEKLEKVITAASLAPVGLPKDGRPHLTVVTDEDVLRSLGGAFGPDKDIRRTCFDCCFLPTVTAGNCRNERSLCGRDDEP